MKYIYITDRGRLLAEKLMNTEGLRGELLSYKDFKKNADIEFKKNDFLVFIMAVGIVVRAIAPLIESKFTDPGIVVIDDAGKNVISLLSGHIGGGNELTSKIATFINANPVITTSTDVNNVGAIDVVCKKINICDKKYRDFFLDINMKLVHKKTVNIYIEDDYLNLLKNDLQGFDVYTDIDEFINKYKSCVDVFNCQKKKYTCDIKEYINDRKKDTCDIKEYTDDRKKDTCDIKKYTDDRKKDTCDMEEFILVSDRLSIINMYYSCSTTIYPIHLLIPRLSVLGTGCRRNTSYDTYLESLNEYLNSIDTSIQSIYKLGSIKIKEDEECINRFALEHNIETEFFSKSDLEKVEHKYVGSEFVKKQVGVYSVAQTSADLMSSGRVCAVKYSKNGVTFSLGKNI